MMNKNQILMFFLSALSALSAKSAVQTTCPYIGGTAVYKARSLNAIYNPAILYDDIKICNNIGVYKNGGNNNEDEKGKMNFEAETSYLKSLKSIDKTVILENEDLKIYPNPTIGLITIKYNLNINEKGKIVIYDLLGRERLAIDLIAEVNIVTASTNMLENGVYTYKYLIDNKANKTGKIIKQ